VSLQVIYKLTWSISFKTWYYFSREEKQNSKWKTFKTNSEWRTSKTWIACSGREFPFI